MMMLLHCYMAVCDMDVVVKWYMKPPSARRGVYTHVELELELERMHISPHPFGLIAFHNYWPHSCSFVGWIVLFVFRPSSAQPKKHVFPHTQPRTFCKPFPSNSLWLPPLTPRMLPSRSCPKLVPSQLTVGGSGNLKGRAGRTTDITPHRSCVCGCGIHRLPGNQP